MRRLAQAVSAHPVVNNPCLKAILIASILCLSLTPALADEGVVFEREYQRSTSSVTDQFEVQDLSNDFYLSIKSLEKGLNLVNVWVNGSAVASVVNPGLLKQHLIKLSLKQKNKLEVRLSGQKSGRILLRILNVNSFKPIFGPEEVGSRNKGELQRNFLATGIDVDHILMIESDEARTFGSLAFVKLNGKTIASPSDFILPKRKRFLKFVSVQRNNQISIRSVGKAGSLKISILEPTLKSDQSTSVIGAAGGEVVLEGVAGLSVLPGTFTSDARVILSKTSTAETKLDFDTTSVMFGPSGRSNYEVRINAGLALPNSAILASISVPESFVASRSPNDKLQVFAQVFQDNELATLDSFELIPSRYDPSLGTLSIDVLPQFFTNRRTNDDSFEAVLIVGSTPTNSANMAIAAARTFAEMNEIPEPYLDPKVSPIRMEKMQSDLNFYRISALSSGEKCQGSSLAAPLPGQLEVTGSFDRDRNHYGTDYRAATGTKVNSMAAGVIERIGFDERPLPKPDPRSGKSVKGWGHFIVVLHTDGSRTLYAHLESGSLEVAPFDAVTTSTILGNSDNSGGSSGPHLHVQYAPNGAIYNQEGNVDPDLCVGRNVNGSITVSDNGVLADDAFRVTLNGVVIGETLIGASNTLSASNLKAGTHSLGITCTVAPDNAGTYSVQLADGLTFGDGSTSKSGILSQGGAVQYLIVVPNSEIPGGF